MGWGRQHSQCTGTAADMSRLWMLNAHRGCPTHAFTSTAHPLQRWQRRCAAGVQCQQAAQEAPSPLQLLSEKVRGTIQGKVSQAAQRDRAPRSSSSRAARKTVRQALPGRRKQGSQEAARKRGEPSSKKGSRFYWNITGFPFPLGPLLSRRTIRYEVDRGRMWLFEQEQALGFSNVTTNVRMTVIRLASGGLWVHAPLAATQECVALVKELGCPVEHIVLPTFAVEHKLFVGPFSRAFPSAQVHIAPRQWSWPLWLPVQFFGIFPTTVLRDNDASTPWADEIEQKVFASAVGIGPFSEVAFFHKPSRTLLLTDALIYVPQRPPEVVREANLLEAGGRLQASVRALSGGDPDEPTEEVIASSTAQQLQLGWQRMALQILYFVPHNLLQPARSFAAVSQKLLVSPVLKKLVFSNSPEEVVHLSRRWVEDIAGSWAFRRIIPAHFAAPVAATPQDLRAAFAFVYDEERVPEPGARGPLAWLLGGGASTVSVASFPAADMRALDGLERILRRARVL